MFSLVSSLTGNVVYTLVASEPKLGNLVEMKQRKDW